MVVENSQIGVANLQGAIDLGKEALKSLQLVNGGAVVAILTFYGNVAKDGSTSIIDPADLRCAIALFAAGLGAAILAAMLAYLSQLAEATTPVDSSKNRIGIRTRWLAIVVALASAVLFLLGTGAALNAFELR